MQEQLGVKQSVHEGGNQVSLTIAVLMAEQL